MCCALCQCVISITGWSTGWPFERPGNVFYHAGCKNTGNWMVTSKFYRVSYRILGDFSSQSGSWCLRQKPPTSPLKHSNRIKSVWLSWLGFAGFWTQLSGKIRGLYSLDTSLLMHLLITAFCLSDLAYRINPLICNTAGARGVLDFYQW